MKRIPQPPVNPATRDRERHDFAPGFIFALIGVLVLFCGARHLTNVETVQGNTALEAQLVKSFTSGGLEYVNPSDMPPPPPLSDDPAAAAKALEQMDRISARSAKVKYRVNLGAQTPCPT